jgi:putative glutathione S-transferase
MFYSAFDEFLPEQEREATKGKAGFFPQHLQSEIEDLNAWVYETVNNGVYKTGFATSQKAYEENVYPLFKSLDRLEEHLSQPGHSPYLFGEYITDADIRLYTTLIRFDVGYYTLFKCNIKMIRHDYPRLHEWLRKLYWDESERTKGGAFKRTVRFDQVSGSLFVYVNLTNADHLQIKSGYAQASRVGIVPAGPLPDILPL